MPKTLYYTRYQDKMGSVRYAETDADGNPPLIPSMPSIYVNKAALAALGPVPMLDWPERLEVTIAIPDAQVVRPGTTTGRFSGKAPNPSNGPSSVQEPRTSMHQKPGRAQANGSAPAASRRTTFAPPRA